MGVLSEIDPEFDYENIDEILWNYVYERDNGVCQITGQQGTEIHHIVFKSHGGTNAPKNLALVSKEGHAIQHNRINGTKPVDIDRLSRRIRENERRFRRRMSNGRK